MSCVWRRVTKFYHTLDTRQCHTSRCDCGIMKVWMYNHTFSRLLEILRLRFIVQGIMVTSWHDNWPFVGEIHPSWMGSSQSGPLKLWCFINLTGNNKHGGLVCGDLRCHDVTTHNENPRSYSYDLKQIFRSLQSAPNPNVIILTKFSSLVMYPVAKISLKWHFFYSAQLY